MDNQLFRQKSIERISSPEQLHDYMRVTSPRLWMLLSVIIVLIIGMIVFSMTVKMESTVKLNFNIFRFNYENNGVSEEQMDITIVTDLALKDTLQVGQEVRIANTTGKIAYCYQDNENLIASVELDDPNMLLPEGEYEGEVIIERRSPLDYLLN